MSTCANHQLYPLAVFIEYKMLFIGTHSIIVWKIKKKKKTALSYAIIFSYFIDYKTLHI